MTPEEAKAIQDKIVKDGYTLGFWYGVNCKKCHGVYPIFRNTKGIDDQCYYECQVCGRKTGLHDMPWQAQEEWNNKTSGNLTIFDFL